MFTRSSLYAALCLSLACGAAAQGEGVQEPSATEASTSARTPESSNQMMVIRVVLTIQPAQRSAFLAYLAEESPQVRAMDGCSWYELFQDPNDDNRFLLYEEWASADAFEAYKSTESFSQAFAVLGPMMAGPPSSAYYGAALEGP